MLQRKKLNHKSTPRAAGDSGVDLDLLVAELTARASLVDASIAAKEFLFEQQQRFVDDRAQYRLLFCSRRAGKTTACTKDLIDTALANANSISLFISQTRDTAKDLIWDSLLTKLRLWGIPHEVRLGDLEVVFPNGSKIEVHGCANEKEAQKFLGRAYILVIIDEAQSIGEHLTMLIDQILGPTLLDDPTSRLVLSGTPPPRKIGPFMAALAQALLGKSWSLHRWTFADNAPLLSRHPGKTAEDLIAEVCARRNVPLNDPRIEREYRGRVVEDPDSLIFPLSDKNFRPTPDDITDVVIGLDFGFKDHFAISVLGWSTDRPGLDLLHDESAPGKNYREIAAMLAPLIELYGDKLKSIVGDHDLTLIASLNEMLDLDIQPAKKSEKAAAVKLLSDDVKSGIFGCLPSSGFATEASSIEWAFNNLGHKVFPDKVRIGGGHRDITHATLYGWRECEHHRFEPVVVPVIEKFDHQKYRPRMKSNELWATDLSVFDR